MSGTEVQHARSLQVAIEPDVIDVCDSVSRDTANKCENVRLIEVDVFESGALAAPGHDQVGNATDLAIKRETSINQGEQTGGALTPQGMLVASERLENGALISLAISTAHTVHATAIKQEQPKQTLTKNKAEAKGTKPVKTLSLAASSQDSNAKPRKIRTVQFAEGTTLPIVDVTPKKEKLATSATGKGPTQCLTDTMQVLKRYENDLRVQELNSRRFEQKRMFLTLERVFCWILCVQGGVMLALVAVALVAILKA
jgi:hypothetical protein